KQQQLLDPLIVQGAFYFLRDDGVVGDLDVVGARLLGDGTNPCDGSFLRSRPAAGVAFIADHGGAIGGNPPNRTCAAGETDDQQNGRQRRRNLHLPRPADWAWAPVAALPTWRRGTPAANAARPRSRRSGSRAAPVRSGRRPPARRKRAA